MQVQLCVEEGPEKGRMFVFDQADSFLIGRSIRAHLRLLPEADRFISRTHCLVDVRPPRCIVTDLDSTNGTYVNDERIRQIELATGDLIRVGHTVIRVAIQGARACVHCAECGEPVPGEATASPIGSAENADWVCPECRKVQRTRRPSPEARNLPAPDDSSKGGAPTVRRGAEDRRDAKDGDPPGPAAPRPIPRCFRCGGDAVSAPPDRSCPPDAVFLCAACVDEELEGQPAKVLADRFLLVGPLGRGGMGVVFKGVERRTGRLCAIKQILPEVSRDERARLMFEREMDMQGAVEHPNLVRVLDRARDDDDVLYFITEYLPGGDVEKLMSRVVRGPLPPPLACRLTCDVLRGLEALHARSLIHRDLKPANYLLSRPYREPDCRAKIADYGLVKCFEAAGNSVFDYTRDGVVAGSPLYMAPEQITNYRFVKPPADVYSVGVSLYYMLSARYTVSYPSFMDRGAPRAKKRHPLELVLEEQPIPIRARMPDLPPRLSAIVDRAACKDVAARYQTAEELRRDMEAFMAEMGWNPDPRPEPGAAVCEGTL